MTRRALVPLLAVALVAACAAPAPVPLGTDGRPLPRLYAIRPGDTAAIQFRMLDGLNALRRAAAAPALALSAELNAAAFTHSRDMAVQNRPWHFGSDGSSPIDRARRVGYGGSFLGELISETYETELQTLAAWMEAPQTRDILLNPAGRELGFGYFQEETGKIWWTLVIGAPAAAPAPAF